MSSVGPRPPSASTISGRVSSGVSQTGGPLTIGAAALPSDFPTTTVSSASVASSARCAWPRIQANGSWSAGARSSTSTTDHPRACAASRANQSSGAWLK